MISRARESCRLNRKLSESGLLLFGWCDCQLQTVCLTAAYVAGDDNEVRQQQKMEREKEGIGRSTRADAAAAAYATHALAIQRNQIKKVEK